MGSLFATTLTCAADAMKLGDMPRMIQIRHVPNAVHRRLKAQAATEGLSLSGYVLRELERVASRPTMAELERRLAKRTPLYPRISAADAVRSERDRR